MSTILKTVDIELDKLELRAFTPRSAISDAYVRELADDIDYEGQLTPIIVRPHPTKQGFYQVIDGEHRVRAMEAIMRTTIRAEIRDLTDMEAAALALSINDREGLKLSDLDRAKHIHRLWKEYGMTQEEIAARFNKDQSWVSQQISLVENLTPEVQQKIAYGEIKQRIGVEIAKIPREEQLKIMTRVIKSSEREAQVLVKAYRIAPSNRKDEVLRAHIEDLPKIVPELAETQESARKSLEKMQADVCELATHLRRDIEFLNKEKPKCEDCMFKATCEELTHYSKILVA